MKIAIIMIRRETTTNHTNYTNKDCGAGRRTREDFQIKKPGRSDLETSTDIIDY
jgi:hypothetical protein